MESFLVQGASKQLGTSLDTTAPAAYRLISCLQIGGWCWIAPRSLSMIAGWSRRTAALPKRGHPAACLGSSSRRVTSTMHLQASSQTLALSRLALRAWGGGPSSLPGSLAVEPPWK